MFASRVRKHLTFADGTDTITVTIVKLSGKTLEKAADLRQQEAARAAKALGPEFVREFQSAAAAAPDKPDPVAEAKAKAKARYASYQREAVLQAGIESWSATRPDGKPLPVHEGIDDLDEETCEQLHRAIIDLSVPSEEAVEAETSKD